MIFFFFLLDLIMNRFHIFVFFGDDFFKIALFSNLFVASAENDYSKFEKIRSRFRSAFRKTARSSAGVRRRASMYRLVAISTKFRTNLSRGTFAGAPWADLSQFARGALFSQSAARRSSLRETLSFRRHDFTTNVVPIIVSM